MSAQDCLQPGQFYHGTATRFKPGQMLTPAVRPSHHSDYDANDLHLYMTNSRAHADEYANDAVDPRVPGRKVPQVYVVEPTGRYEADLEDGRGTAWQTEHALRVVKRVKHGIGIPGHAE